MKKIICLCLCLCLMSGCGKLLNHGSTVNTVVENDEGREDVLTPTQTSKTALEPSKSPAPTSSSSETAPVLPDSAASSSWFSWYGYVPTINLVDNPVAYWALNAVVYAVIAVGCAVVYRLVRPLEDYYNDYDSSDEYIDVPFGEVSERGYKLCYTDNEEITSYTWYLFKKVTARCFFRDSETKAELKGIPIIMNDNDEAHNNDSPCPYLYKPNPAPSNIEE